MTKRKTSFVSFLNFNEANIQTNHFYPIIWFLFFKKKLNFKHQHNPMCNI